jgi:transcriptional regulator with XRE-family HTH domain
MPDESLSVCKGTIADIETEEETALENLGRLEQKQLFVELRAKGWSLRRCAEAIGVSKSTLATWCHELEAEIASLKAIELEALYEQFHLSKEARIQTLGAQVAALRQELDSRDMSEVSTEKLLELLLKWQQALSEEYVEPRPLSSQQVKRLQDRTGAELDSQKISEELDETLQRYKAGLIEVEQARQELALLLAMLKAREQTDLERKLESIEAVLEARG